MMMLESRTVLAGMYKEHIKRNHLSQTKQEKFYYYQVDCFHKKKKKTIIYITNMWPNYSFSSQKNKNGLSGSLSISTHPQE